MCGNPAYAEQSFDPASGDYSESYRTKAEAARAEDGLCGYEALLFEPKSLLAVAVSGARKGLGDLGIAIGAVGLALGFGVMLFG